MNPNLGEGGGVGKALVVEPLDEEFFCGFPKLISFLEISPYHLKKREIETRERHRR